MRQFRTFQHFKGGLYLVLGEALHTESQETLLVYVCAVSGAMFCRPKAMFEEIIETDTYKGPRFIPIPDSTSKEQRKAIKWPA